MNGSNHDAMRLPWTLENVPHGVLDILRGCNIHCRSCYNSQPDRIKPLAEIEAELDTLMRLRRLHSVSIVGGEITLHPELIEIVRLVRRRGLFVELCSNGVELNDHLLAALSEAGANVIFLHIEPNQRRPDLLENATAEDVRRLRAEKAALVAAHGIQAGLTVTAYPEKLAEVEDAFAFALESPHIGWLLVTWCRDINRMPPIHGDLATGMYAESGFAPHQGREEEASLREIERLLETKAWFEAIRIHRVQFGRSGPALAVIHHWRNASPRRIVLPQESAADLGGKGGSRIIAQIDWALPVLPVAACRTICVAFAVERSGGRRPRGESETPGTRESPRRAVKRQAVFVPTARRLRRTGPRNSLPVLS